MSVSLSVALAGNVEMAQCANAQDSDHSRIPSFPHWFIATLNHFPIPTFYRSLTLKCLPYASINAP